MNGPRLKRAKDWFLISARYDNGFPIMPCNIEMLTHSISYIRSHFFSPIPAEF